jgi:hypothetical protein
MTQEENKVEGIQAVVNEEFDKSFNVNLNGNTYVMAISKDEIPKVYSFEINDNVLKIVIVDNLSKINTSQIFKLVEDKDGEKMAVFNFSNKYQNFSEKRKYWSPIIDSADDFKHSAEIISFVKSKKLVHAILQILTKIKDPNIHEAILKIHTR